MNAEMTSVTDRSPAIGDVVRRVQQARRARLAAMELTSPHQRLNDASLLLVHELCNSLSAIRNAARLLSMQEAETDMGQKARFMIERQINGMTRLVDDAMCVSRIGGDRLRLQRERIDLRGVLERALETVAMEMVQRNHRLNTSMCDSPVWLLADADRLEQVFVNLLNNAAKYTDSGGDLHLSMQVDGDQAVVRVQDSGIGIAAELLPHIFNLFTRAEQSLRRGEPGLGIGLALVRSLVELHGGSVVAASSGLGQGSEFIVHLPLI